MALDNAQFIAELSVIDPPGTDPVNQGDDHIRTTKLAVQQSFPNVGSAVPQTGVQMAQMAIKNEANIFTQINTFQQEPLFQDNILLDSGVNNRIKFSFGTVQAWEWLHVGADARFELRRFVGGILVDAPFQINNAFGEATFLADVTFSKTVLLPDGVEAAPSYRFSGRTTTGMWASAGDRINWSTAGVKRAFLDVSQFQTQVQINSIDGSPTAPAYAFVSQQNMGWYRENPDTLAVAVAGVRQARIFPTLFQFFQDIQGTGGVFTGLLQAQGNAVPSSVDDVIVRGSSFTFDEVIGFAKQTFYQDDIIFNDLADNRPQVRWRTSSSTRWEIGSKGLSGTQFELSRYNSSGVFQDNPMVVEQSNGQILFANRFKCDGGAMELRSAATSTAATYQLKPGGILFWEMASGNIASPLLSFVRYSNAGAFLGLPLQIERLTGTVIMPDLSTSNPGGSGKLWKSGGFVAIT